MTPLERAARALMLHQDVDPDVYVGMHGGFGDWLDAARAVVGALREPSDAMEHQGWRNYNNGPCVVPIWQAMIDAIETPDADA